MGNGHQVVAGEPEQLVLMGLGLLLGMVGQEQQALLLGRLLPMLVVVVAVITQVENQGQVVLVEGESVRMEIPLETLAMGLPIPVAVAVAEGVPQSEGQVVQELLF